MKKGFYKVYRRKDDFLVEKAIIEKFERQRTMDAVCFALNEMFNFGPARFETFRDAFERNYNGILHLQQDDCKDDMEMSYSIGKIDEAMKRIVGDDLFVPWEKRYYGEEWL